MVPDQVFLSDMPGHLIRRLNQQATAVFQRHMKEAGYSITSVQYSALRSLADYPGQDQARLAKRIAYDPATIGNVVKTLEQKGFVHRKPSARDRRAFEISLSPAGESVLRHIGPIVLTLQDDILDRLGTEESASLITLMQKALGLEDQSAADDL